MCQWVSRQHISGIWDTGVTNHEKLNLDVPQTEQKRLRLSIFTCVLTHRYYMNDLFSPQKSALYIAKWTEMCYNKYVLNDCRLAVVFQNPFYRIRDRCKTCLQRVLQQTLINYREKRRKAWRGIFQRSRTRTFIYDRWDRPVLHFWPV